MSILLQELKYGIRLLIRTPACILTAALLPALFGVRATDLVTFVGVPRLLARLRYE
jgi:hypothetical protein